MLEDLVHRFGYLGIFLGTAVEGEGVLIAGGILARHGALSLPLVVLAAFAGSLGATQGWFAFGRRSGARLLESRPRWRDRAETVRGAVERRGALFVVGYRFVIGTRTLTPAVLGASGYPRRRFLVLDAVGAALWSVVVGLAGWSLGSAVVLLLRRAARLEELLALSVLAILALVLVRRLVRHARAKP